MQSVVCVCVCVGGGLGGEGCGNANTSNQDSIANMSMLSRVFLGEVVTEMIIRIVPV